MKKSLFDSNPYLQNPKKYRDALILNVASSSSIESGIATNKIIKHLNKSTSDIGKPKSIIDH